MTLLIIFESVSLTPRHCMQWRGVKDTDSKMINSVMRGVFLTDASLRREFLALLRRNGS